MWLDVHALRIGRIQTVDLNLIIEVTNVTDDRLILHLPHMLQRDDVLVTGRGHVDIRLAKRGLDRVDLKTFHGGLQRIDGIDLRHNDTGAKAFEGKRRTLTDITVAANTRDFTGNHDVRGALQTIGERLAATVEVVKFRLGDGVIHIDRGHAEFALLEHLIKAVHAGGRLL